MCYPYRNRNLPTFDNRFCIDNGIIIAQLDSLVTWGTRPHCLTVHALNGLLYTSSFCFSVLGSLFPDSGLTRRMLPSELRTKSHHNLAEALCVYFSWMVRAQENPTSVSWVFGTDRPMIRIELRTVYSGQVGLW